MKKSIVRSILGTILVLCALGKPVSVLVHGLDSIQNDPSPAASISEYLDMPGRIIFQNNKKDNIIFLTHKKNVALDTESVFLQGKIKYRGRKYPVAAAKINGQIKITFPSIPTRSSQRLYTLTISKSGKARLASVPSSVAHASSCANHTGVHTETSPKVMAINEGVPSNLSHVVTLHTYADQDWIAKYGIRSNSEIAAIVNVAEALYTRQLGIKFRIVGQNNYITTETDPQKILSSFREDAATQNNETDLKHVFTAKDMDSPAVGVAYVGALCVYPDWSYGLTQDYFTYTPYIFAHEIGHNFGARHVVSGLMSPYIGPGSLDGFSAESLSQVNEHLNYFGSCLSLEQVAPDLNRAKLSITFRNGAVTGQLTTADGTPISNKIIYVTLDGRRKIARTDSTGTYKVRVTSKGRHVAQASTQQKEKTSRSIRFTIR